MNQTIWSRLLQVVSQSLRLRGLSILVGTALASTASSAETVVYTVNYPLTFFAERIGGRFVTVRFPAPPQVDPAFWKPDPEIISAYQSADLILRNGAGYAGWIGQASLPRRKLVDTSRSFRDAYLAGEEQPGHQHGPGGEHSHGQIAFTTWLDPQLAIAQTRAIEAAFARLLPEYTPGFSERTDALVFDLERIDCELAAALGVFSTEPLLASHPIYDYLARRYSLDLRSITWEPELDPGETGWRALDTLLSEQPARWMLWESTPQDSIREKLATRGVGVIVFEVASNRPPEGDYLSVMDENLRRLRSAIGQQPVPPPSCARSR